MLPGRYFHASNGHDRVSAKIISLKTTETNAPQSISALKIKTYTFKAKTGGFIYNSSSYSQHIKIIDHIIKYKSHTHECKNEVRNAV